MQKTTLSIALSQDSLGLAIFKEQQLEYLEAYSLRAMPKAADASAGVYDTDEPAGDHRGFPSIYAVRSTDLSFGAAVLRTSRSLPYFAGMEIGHITKSVVDHYRAHRHSEKRVTDSTINHDLQFLRHILYWAVDQGFLPDNPLKRLKLEKPRRKKRPIMSLEDEEKLLRAAAGHLRKIVICALDTGMRRGEILSQRWEDVDFSRQVLSVTRSKTAGGESREIPLTKRLFDLLSKERQPEGLIFTLKGRPIHQLKTGWKAAIRRAKLRYYRFKDLRSSFNSRLIEAGVIKDVRKELMGHSRNEDTNDLYSHIELPTLREAIEKLEQWVAKHNRNQSLCLARREWFWTTTANQNGSVDMIC